MTRAVWKFPFRVAGAFTIGMPRGAKVLHVAIQGDQAYMWAMVDPGEEIDHRRFRMYGTGHPIDDSDYLTHLGTFFDGPFVWHVFE